MSRREFLKNALPAVGLAFIGSMALLGACNSAKKDIVQTQTVSTETEKVTAPVATTNQTTDATAPPIASITTDSRGADYSLAVDGLVDTPLALGYEGLAQFASVTQSVILSCPGVFEETSEWTGVPVITILSAAGVKPEAMQVTIDSGNHPVTFSIQDQAITSGDIFLAFNVDGKLLPPDRGYPLRLVVPNMDGIYWVRGVNHIKVT